MMSWLDGLTHRLRRLIRPNEFRQELDEEFDFHRELDDLQKQDRRRFGNRTYYQEETRRMTWLGALDPLRQDVSYVLRSIARAPSFTLLVVLTLALGLGTTSALFSFIDRLYLRPPAGVESPATLRRVWIQHSRTEDFPAVSSQPMNLRRFRAIADASDAAHFAGYFPDGALRFGGGRSTQPLHGTFVSASYFQVLGAKITLGRFFATDEDRFDAPQHVVVLSHRFWKKRLRGDSAIIGRPVVIERIPHIVIGIAAPEFSGLELQSTDVWLPLADMPRPAAGKFVWWESDNTHWLRAVVRTSSSLVPFEFEQRATQQLRQANRQEKTMALDTATRVQLGPIIEARGPGELGQELEISTRLAGVAAIVLLIACANVVNLLLARATARRRETAVRLALGIARSRLMRLVTLESVVLAAIAALGAVIMSTWSGAILRAMLLPDVRWSESAMHWRVAVFTFAIALPLGVIAGLIPAAQASRATVSRDLKSSSRDGVQQSRLRSGLLVMQAALSVVLLIGAGLFVTSLLNVRGVDIGYDSSRLLFGQMRFEDGETPPAATLDARMLDVASRLERLPGVEVVARAAMPPMYGMSFAKFFFGSDSSTSLGSAAPSISVVSSNFFRTVGIPIIRGSAFSQAAAPTAEIIVNEAAANLMWPGREPLGECVRFEDNEDCHRVIGVVPNVHQMRVIEKRTMAHMYVPLLSRGWDDWAGGTVVVRTRPGGIDAASKALRDALRRAFPEATERVTLMTENLEPEYRPWKLGATLFTAFGFLALLVAMIGVYSNVAYSVSQRMHEFGVRIALGARICHILRLVIGSGLRAVAVGIVLGILLSLAAGRLVTALLYGVQPYNPALLLIVSLLIVSIAALAALIPATRATNVDPVTSLKTE